MIYIIAAWTFFIFIGAADRELFYNSLVAKQTLIVAAVAMILRVWAMYNRSRLILNTLLVLFFLEIIFGVLDYAMYSDPRNLSCT